MSETTSTAFFTTEILGAFLDTLERSIVLPALMWRDVERDFQGNLGRTVNVRKPQIRTADTALVGPQDFNGIGIGGPLDAAEEIPTLTAVANVETYIPVTLDTRVYDRQPVSDFAQTTDIQDRNLQVFAPMLRAVARGLEDEAAALMTGATYPDAAAGGTYSIKSSTAATTPGEPEDFVDLMVDLASQLDDNNVPMEDRVLVIGSDYQRNLLKAPSVKQVDRSGSDSALRRAQILDLYGFQVIRSNAIPSDEAYAFHRSAYIMAIRPPVAPMGAKESGSLTTSGMAITGVYDYGNDTAVDDVLMSAFVGTEVNTDPGLSPADVAGAPVLLRALKIEVDSA